MDEEPAIQNGESKDNKSPSDSPSRVGRSKLSLTKTKTALYCTTRLKRRIGIGLCRDQKPIRLRWFSKNKLMDCERKVRSKKRGEETMKHRCGGGGGGSGGQNIFRERGHDDLL